MAEDNHQRTAVSFEDEEPQRRAAQVSREAVLALPALFEEDIFRLQKELSTGVARLCG